MNIYFSVKDAVLNTVCGLDILTSCNEKNAEAITVSQAIEQDKSSDIEQQTSFSDRK